MKSRTVIILWSLAAVLGVIACIIQFGGDDDSASRTQLAAGDKLIDNLPIREIAKVTLKKGETTTTLKHLDKETWGVVQRSGYRGDCEKLRSL